MSYRKLQADYLFTGTRLLNNGEVLITKPTGEIVTISDKADAGENIETFEGIITPGFINAHCHLELSHMKGVISEKTGLVDFVYRVITKRQLPETAITEAISKAQDEMMDNGIVAIGDICNNTSTLPFKLLPRFNYYNFIEVSGWAPSLSEIRWEKSKALYDEYIRENLSASIVPHAPYSVSNDLWQKIANSCKGKIVTMHNQESNFENELFLKGTGDMVELYKNMGIDNSFFLPGNKTSLQACFHNLSDAASVILVHNTFTSEADVAYIIKHKPDDQAVSFCLCPNANLYIENTLPPVEMLVNNDCRIILGTDSLASNHSLSILDEMKTIQHFFPFLSLQTLLQWATLNGAMALQLQNSLGSFEKGKTPGVVLIEKMNGEIFEKNTTSRRLL